MHTTPEDNKINLSKVFKVPNSALFDEFHLGYFDVYHSLAYGWRIVSASISQRTVRDFLPMERLVFSVVKPVEHVSDALLYNLSIRLK